MCGGYTYHGVRAKDFWGLYEAILEMVDRSTIDDVLNISNYRYWNALNIYDELIARKWENKMRSDCMIFHRTKST